MAELAEGLLRELEIQKGVEGSCMEPELQNQDTYMLRWVPVMTSQAASIGDMRRKGTIPFQESKCATLLLVLVLPVAT